MRLSLLILSITFCMSANAQITKGSTLLGGSLNFITGTNQGTAFNISAQYGKAYKTNSFHGFQIRFSHSHQNSTRGNGYSGGIFYRKYIPIVTGFYFFGEANFDLGYNKLSSGFSDPAATSNKITTYYGSVSLIPGLSYAVNSKLHLEIAFSNLASLSYAHQEYKSTTGGVSSSNNENIFQLNTSTQLNSLSNIQFGFRLLLQKKAK